MKSYLNTLAAAAVALTAAAPGFAQSQLAASAGLSPAEAARLSLTEIAQANFNRGDRDDQHVIVAHDVASPAAKANLAANAGMSPAEAQGATLSEIAAVKFSRETRGGDRQSVAHGGNVTVAARSVVDNRALSQLVTSAGLTPQQATGLSLTAIAAAKFDRDTQN